MLMATPAFKNESSRRRWDRVSKLNSTFSKIWVSERKVILVPVFFVLPTTWSGERGFPLS